MLNPFPILYLAPLGYFILRSGVAIMLINIALHQFQHRISLKEAFSVRVAGFSSVVVALLIAGELIIGTLLLIGAYTQYASLALLVMSVDMILAKGLVRHFTLPSRQFYILLVFISATLFLTGAGAFAVDLPL